MPNRNILLFSGGQSENHQPYYHYCRDWLDSFLKKFLPPNPEVLYIPWTVWAGVNPDKTFFYGQKNWRPFGLDLISLHTQPDYLASILSADAIIVEGGSIHMLVRDLELNSVMLPLKDKIESGCLYIGTSAGTVITCPTMHTATEPPLIHIPSHKTLGIIPFQITPHYYEVLPDQFHNGPSPKARVINYLQLNPDPRPVLCLSDGSYLHIQDQTMTNYGQKEVIIFDRKSTRHSFPPNSNLSPLLNFRSKYFKP